MDKRAAVVVGSRVFWREPAMSIKSFVSFALTCAAAAVFVLIAAGNGQTLELCAKSMKTVPTQARNNSPIKLRAECKTGKEVSIGSTADLATIALKADQLTVDQNSYDIEALQDKSLSCASQIGNDVYFEGCNVHVRNGVGATDAAVNGLGNLIVGYDEDGGTSCADPFGCDIKNGSHNLVVGRHHTYSSYGGLVAGTDNTVSAAASSVSGGYGNTASELRSSVSGGSSNTASGDYSSVSGGSSNRASGSRSSVSGGISNTASGQNSSVSGGDDNTSSDRWSSVSGGNQNTANGDYAWIGGGLSNYAGKVCSSGTAGVPCSEDSDCDSSSTSGDGACGGGYNALTGKYAAVSGGETNIAHALASSVSGGENNTASGENSSVSGGRDNAASGWYSSVSGGRNNAASGHYSSISGGHQNSAALTVSAPDDYTSVSGGRNNIASGQSSSVSGGNNVVVNGIDDWAAGSLFED